MPKTVKHFVLEDFMKGEARTSPLMLESTILDDGDHVVLRPVADGRSAYRVNKKDIVSRKPLSGTDTSGAPLFMVEIGATAPVLRLTPGSAAGLLGSIGAALLATQKASIAFKANGEGSFEFGSSTFPCLGSPSVSYTKDLTVNGEIGVDKFEKKYSTEFDVWMPFAILIMGSRGIYIHEGADNLKDNGGPSAGCIHLAPGNAKNFYDWVSKPTRIVISYPWSVVSGR